MKLWNTKENFNCALLKTAVVSPINLLSWHLQTILHVCEMNATRRKMKVMVLRCQEGYPHPLVPSSSITTIFILSPIFFLLLWFCVIKCSATSIAYKHWSIRCSMAVRPRINDFEDLQISKLICCVLCMDKKEGWMKYQYCILLHHIICLICNAFICKSPWFKS